MRIELTTRQLLHMMQESYIQGAKDLKEGKVVDASIKSEADNVSQALLMRHLWENDSHLT